MLVTQDLNEIVQFLDEVYPSDLHGFFDSLMESCDSFLPFEDYVLDGMSDSSLHALGEIHTLVDLFLKKEAFVCSKFGCSDPDCHLCLDYKAEKLSLLGDFISGNSYLLEFAQETINSENDKSAGIFEIMNSIIYGSNMVSEYFEEFIKYVDRTDTVDSYFQTISKASHTIHRVVVNDVVLEDLIMKKSDESFSEEISISRDIGRSGFSFGIPKCKVVNHAAEYFLDGSGKYVLVSDRIKGHTFSDIVFGRAFDTDFLGNKKKLELNEADYKISISSLVNIHYHLKDENFDRYSFRENLHGKISQRNLDESIVLDLEPQIVILEDSSEWGYNKDAHGNNWMKENSYSSEGYIIDTENRGLVPIAIDLAQLVFLPPKLDINIPKVMKNGHNRLYSERVFAESLDERMYLLYSRVRYHYALWSFSTEEHGAMHDACPHPKSVSDFSGNMVDDFPTFYREFVAATSYRYFASKCNALSCWTGVEDVMGRTVIDFLEWNLNPSFSMRDEFKERVDALYVPHSDSFPFLNSEEKKDLLPLINRMKLYHHDS